MLWNPELYQSRHSYVAEYGRSLVDRIDHTRPLVILDLGCGTGTLTHELALRGHTAIGIDGSAAMVEKAKTLYPNLDFQVMDGCAMTWESRFDVVFSNAVFHWIPRQETLLGRIHAALKPGGALLCEFGAEGNIAHIEEAFRSLARHHGFTPATRFFFPAGQAYQLLLEAAGFSVLSLDVYERPTPLRDGWAGLRNWAGQFYADALGGMASDVREAVLTGLEETLRRDLWDGTQWVADYRRIRVEAVKA